MPTSDVHNNNNHVMMMIFVLLGYRWRHQLAEPSVKMRTNQSELWDDCYDFIVIMII